MEKYSAGKFWGIRLLSLIATAALVVLLQYVLLPHLDGYDTRLIFLSLLFASLAVSLNMINGITGQFSIGHAAFWLVGAYTTARLTNSLFASQPLDTGMWLIVMCIAGAVSAAIAGFIVGLPSLRLRGDYLAIVTLGFGEIARIIVQNQDGKANAFFGLDLGGSFGMTVTPKMATISHVLLLLILTVAVSRNILKTAHGLPFLAVREDEIAAEATGVNTTKTKVSAFIIGAALAGVAGALFAHYEGFITPTHFDMNASFIIVAMVVIGGTGSITGAAVAGVALTLMQEALRKLESIAAIDLIAYIVAAIFVLTLIIKTRPLARTRSESSKRLFAWAGVLGSIGSIYAAYVLFNADLSMVIKIGMLAVIFGSIGALTLSAKGRQGLPVFGVVVVALVIVVLLRAPLAALLHQIPFVESNLGTTSYTPANLRMAIFAFALVVVMLSRPQGLFGHHEFSWDWVKSIFGKQHKESEIAA